jgi:hypothetical protein
MLTSELVNLGFAFRHGVTLPSATLACTLVLPGLPRFGLLARACVAVGREDGSEGLVVGLTYPIVNFKGQNPK